MSRSPYFDAWVADGRPWRPATPIAECAGKIKAALPGVDPAAIIGTIGDINHLLALPPEDHCPYSQTGWPIKHPYPVVNAIDIIHRPDLGVNCNEIFPHWLAEARAGRLPWLKYLMWQAKRYDVRNGWGPVAAQDHFDHMHASGRSDTTAMSIGGFHPLPGFGDEVTPKEHVTLENSDANAWATRMLFNPTVHSGNDPNGAEVKPGNNLASVLRAILDVVPEIELVDESGQTVVVPSQLALALARIEELASKPATLQLTPEDRQKIVDDVLAGLKPALEALAADTRDAVADLGEGGAAQVRAGM